MEVLLFVLTLLDIEVGTTVSMANEGLELGMQVLRC
jgi:hypothetical protein